MKRFLAGMFLFISFGATAECWVVGDMRGISYSERNNFQPEEDGFSGNDSNLLIVFYVQIMPDDFVMQLHRF
ncbi:hypothetical protein FQH39_18115 [Escherichia coli]|nr:hypothetical protein [Escherichia coli]